MREVANDWQRLSPWAILHFAGKALFQNVQALIFAAPATYGASRWGNAELAWTIPIGIMVAVLVGSWITYLFYAYRVLEDSIQVRRGALFKKHVDLSFRRIQNVTIEQPLYFRPLGRVTLKIDGAGSAREEVNVAALDRARAEAIRTYILRQKNRLDPKASADDASPLDRAVEGSEAFFTRSLADLIVHGLTNNRSFLAVAGALAILWQSNWSPADVIDRLGIDFDVVIAGMSLVRLALLIVMSLVLAIGIIAALSVLVAIFTYYGFSMYRTADGLRVKRGLLTKHEIHVRKSRIQTITLRQDWLDRLLGRRNVIFELVSHSRSQQDPSNTQSKRIFVPSVRETETSIVLDEILPSCRFGDLPFTPINIRYFYKHAAISAAFYLPALVASLWLPATIDWLTLALLLVWPLHVFALYMSWRRGGLAIDGEIVVARSGTIGIDYRIFPAYKIQDVTHIQSVLMRRHHVSSLRFHTASSTIGVPYMNTDFMKSVADYCAFQAESTQRSWM